MKTFTSSFSGLASSLFLNVGLTQIAQKLDPVTALKHKVSATALTSEMSDLPCHFTARKGQ